MKIFVDWYNFERKQFKNDVVRYKKFKKKTFSNAWILGNYCCRWRQLFLFAMPPSLHLKLAQKSNSASEYYTEYLIIFYYIFEPVCNVVISGSWDIISLATTKYTKPNSTPLLPKMTRLLYNWKIIKTKF